MSAPVLRIHPAIGLARVGNSDEYYLAPESSAGMAQPGTTLVGGLPIKPGTESAPISDQDLRDGDGALKRQAQRFRIYQYEDPAAAARYPYQGAVQEITLGSVIDGKKVTDIVWTVHLANKKTNCWQLMESVTPPAIGSLSAYDNNQLPPMRNLDFAGTSAPSDPQRLASLVIDAGPRAIHGANAARIKFDGATTPSWYQPGKGIQPLPDYPVSFPADHFSTLYSPSGTPVQELGAIETDAKGRLIAIGGQGTATGWYQQEVGGPPGAPGQPFPLNDDVNNDGWFDDTSDGPVQAVLVFADGSTLPLASTARVVSTDPAYAPQIRNAITLWDEVYDTWLCCFKLDPSIYNGPCMPQDDSGFIKSYQPSFDDDVLPLFRSASLQTFVTSLNDTAVASHQRLAAVNADSDPAKTLNVPSFIRNPYPNGGQLQSGAPRMPLALGDTGAAYLTLTKTQYFFINQWFQGLYSKTPGIPLTAGELLDKNVLTNCLGGRFSPGIDLTFVVRDTAFYNPAWQDPNVGPFRVNAAPLDYSKATKDNPFLGVGYTPERRNTFVEPGDVCKFMALPWHTDYNSCATHLPDPNPGGDITNPNQVFDGRNLTLLWSWPAQRPVSVYNYQDLVAAKGTLPQQRFSVRGEGTPTIPGPNAGVYPPVIINGQISGGGPDGSFFEMEQVGRFQNRVDILNHWPEIGTVVQGPAIAGYPTTFDQTYFLEVASRMTNASDLVEPYPNTLTQTVEPTS